MDQHESNKPSPPAPPSGGPMPQPPAAAGSGERPQAGGLLIAVAIAGALAGIIVVLAVVGVRTTPPVETAEAASIPPAPSAPLVESTPPPTWTGARRTSWASDGSKTVVFTLAASRDVPVWMAHARPALVVRCLSRATEVFVMLDTSASFEEEADRRTVRVQWDNEQMRVQQWAVSESGKEFFAPDGTAVVRRMASARVLRFGFTPFNAQPVTAEFAVQGFDKLAGLVASTCGWRLDS